MTLPDPTAATPEGTSRYFSRLHPSWLARMPFRPFGKTGLSVSPVGFGGYRILEEEPVHHHALRDALLSGCNLIDTSANYGDGSSERLIGDVLAELAHTRKLSRDEVVIVTKAGYIQGSNMDVVKERAAEGKPFSEVVEYDTRLWHCISPDFLEDQLTRSLERLQLSAVDVFLLHNPEYYLKAEGDHREYYRRIRKAFEYLETEVKRGRIRHYGISSNTFPEQRESEQYTSLESVWEIAEEIAQADPELAGRHHFSVIQFPFNLFEPGAAFEENNSGKSLIEYARQNNLGTLINRPLNSFTESGMVRLASFPPHDERDIAGDLKAAWTRTMQLESTYPKLSETPPVPPTQLAWGHILRQNFQKLQDLDTWKNTLAYQIRPSLSNALTELQGGSAAFQDWAREYREMSAGLFEAFQAYLENQASYQSDLLSSKIDHACPDLHPTEELSRKVIRLYLSIPGVDCVLLGMRRPEYVRDAMKLDPPVSAEQALKTLQLMQSQQQ